MWPMNLERNSGNISPANFSLQFILSSDEDYEQHATK